MILILIAIIGNGAWSLRANYTRLYVLDGREVQGTSSYLSWPTSFAVMRSPWEGISGYGHESDVLGLDDFVLVVGYAHDGAELGDNCISLIRV